MVSRGCEACSTHVVSSPACRVPQLQGATVLRTGLPSCHVTTPHRCAILKGYRTSVPHRCTYCKPRQCTIPHLAPRVAYPRPLLLPHTPPHPAPPRPAPPHPLALPRSPPACLCLPTPPTTTAWSSLSPRTLTEWCGRPSWTAPRRCSAAGGRVWAQGCGRRGCGAGVGAAVVGAAWVGAAWVGAAGFF